MLVIHKRINCKAGAVCTDPFLIKVEAQRQTERWKDFRDRQTEREGKMERQTDRQANKDKYRWAEST